MSEIKKLSDASHWRQLVTSVWLRGADLDPNKDTILTVKSIEYKNPGKAQGIDEFLLVVNWVEAGWKPYGTQTVENLKALAKVYGTDDPNKWVAGQKLALYPKMVTAFGDTSPAVRIRATAPQFISEDQVMELEEMLSKSGSDRAKFFEWAGISRIEDMTAQTYNKAKQALSAKASKAKGE